MSILIEKKTINGRVFKLCLKYIDGKKTYCKYKGDCSNCKINRGDTTKKLMFTY